MTRLGELDDKVLQAREAADILDIRMWHERYGREAEQNAERVPLVGELIHAAQEREIIPDEKE